MIFAPFINPYSTEYFVEYGPNKGGGKPSAPSWKGDEEGDPFPFDAGEGTDFLTWFNTWVERRPYWNWGNVFLNTSTNAENALRRVNEKYCYNNKNYGDL